MSKLQLFRDFVNERLAAAALEIFGQYEKTLAECQEEACRCKEKSAQLHRRMLDIQPEIKLRRTDVQPFSLPEPPQIKEEQEQWTSQGVEQLQRLQSDTTDPITSPRVKTCCDPEDASQLPPFEQTSAVENRVRDSLPTNTTEEQIKVESNEEDCGAPEPASDSQLPSVTPHSPTSQSLEEEDKERGGLLPELTTFCLRLVPTICSSPGPSPWTKPIPSSCSGIKSEDISSLEVESKTPEKLYEDGKASSQRDSSARHRSTHTGENPYQCKQCDKAFRQRCSLVRHRKIHTGEKPIHTRERQYQCKQCDKVFHSTSHLNSHIRIHTGEKPFQCKHCGKAFSQNSSLVKHRRIHTGEKPYQCQQCDKAFSDPSVFARHRRIHAREKRIRVNNKIKKTPNRRKPISV